MNYHSCIPRHPNFVERTLMLNTRPGKHSQFAIEAMAIEIVYPY